MAVKIIERQYTDLYKPNDITDWLLANVGDWQTLKLKCEVGADFIATNSKTISINTDINRITFNDGSNWGALGFDLGDTPTLRYTLTVIDENDQEVITVEEVEFTIELMLGDTIEYSGGVGLGALDYALIPTDRGTEKVTNVRVFVEKEFEGATIVYGHITNANSESNNLNSFIDGTTAKLGYVGLNNLAVDTWALMDFVGLQSGMSIRQARIKRLDANSNILAAFLIAGGTNFDIGTFRVGSFLGNDYLQQNGLAFRITPNNAIPNHFQIKQRHVSTYQPEFKRRRLYKW